MNIDRITHGIQNSGDKQQLAYYCDEFRRHIGFDNYLLYGSIFSSLTSHSEHIIFGPKDFPLKGRSSLKHLIKNSGNSVTPVITGNITRNSLLETSQVKTFHIPKAKKLDVLFPIHFPLGKIAFLYLSTTVKKDKLEELVFATLPVGKQLATEAGIAILALLENELENKQPYLNPREKECLLLASDGYTPEEIGTQIGLSVHTVAFYLKNAREKLQSKNIQGAVCKAMLGGEISTLIGPEKT